jgi:hypothetical protein
MPYFKVISQHLARGTDKIIRTLCRDWMGQKYHSVKKATVFKHRIHFFMILLTFETDTIWVGMFILLSLLSLSDVLMLCVIPHPFALLSSSEL